MSLQEKMFLEVENWYSSGLSKQQFLDGKAYSQAKFNYWLLKWKQNQPLSPADCFREVSFSDSNGKVLEIVTASGLKITIFG